MAIDRFTWFGLALALVGWAVLVADLFVAESVLKAGNLVAVTALRGDVVTLSQTAILSGIGLAVVGVLRRGFGSLHRLFEAVLAPPVTVQPLPVEERPEPKPPMPAAPVIVERMPVTGQIKDRNYVILPDGSVEVDTLLGTRVFASLDEARDFIR
ncbi:MAG TPA: hypothetical protein VH414_07665 [Lichenihabitans sp.]|jgi:hypothetical protein|nr:hypothetical protein [Lichenihabitans sp.]